MVALLFSAGVVFLLDLSAKRKVERRGESHPIALGRLLDIRHVASRKRIYCSLAFRRILIAVWLTAFLSAALLTRTDVLDTVVAQLAVGAALGGAAGNLLDIMRSQSVRDYIDLGWWPVFNLADVAILGGLALAFIPR
jgi:signal peptidase II